MNPFLNTKKNIQAIKKATTDPKQYWQDANESIFIHIQGRNMGMGHLCYFNRNTCDKAQSYGHNRARQAAIASRKWIIPLIAMPLYQRRCSRIAFQMAQYGRQKFSVSRTLRLSLRGANISDTSLLEESQPSRHLSNEGPFCSNDRLCGI